jgi:hypothetical protein
MFVLLISYAIDLVPYNFFAFVFDPTIPPFVINPTLITKFNDNWDTSQVQKIETMNIFI